MRLGSCTNHINLERLPNDSAVIHIVHIACINRLSSDLRILPLQETRLGSYNNYTNLEEQVKAGLKTLDTMWKACGPPAKVLSPFMGAAPFPLDALAVPKL